MDKIKLSCGYYRSHSLQHAAQPSVHQWSKVIHVPVIPDTDYRPLYLTFKMNEAVSSLLTLFPSELVPFTWTE